MAYEVWMYKKVLVHNTEDEGLNGRVGSVVGVEGGKLAVVLESDEDGDGGAGGDNDSPQPTAARGEWQPPVAPPDMHGGIAAPERDASKERLVHPTNVVEAGEVLRIHGLQNAAHLNGKEGYRLGPHAAKGERVAVVVRGTGQSVSVKPENLKAGRRGAGSVLIVGEMVKQQALPAKVDGLKGHRVVDISCGMMHIAVVTSVGDVYCWGGNDVHQCCASDDKMVATPRKVALCETVHAVACGAAHTVVVSDSGMLYAWGANGQGTLGQGDARERRGVVRIHMVTRLRAVACGLGHVVALDTDGVLWGWGWNHAGQLGLGTRDNVLAPTQVKGDVNIASCGGGHTVVIDRSGVIWGTGSNACGQLGLGHDNNQLDWCAVSGIDTPSLVCCGEEFTIVVKENHEILSCGIGIVGQLGNGAGGGEMPTSCPNFVKVKLVAPVELIACSQKEVVAIDRDGKSYSWGSGDATPGPLENMSKRKILQLVCGRKFHCFVLDGVHPGKCTAEGVRDRTAGERVVYTITQYTTLGERSKTGGEEVAVSCTDDVDDNFDGTYSAVTKVTAAGLHRCRITIVGEDIAGSPFTYYVSPGPVSLPHSAVEVWCPSQHADGSVPAGNSVFLIFSLCDKFGNAVSAPAGDFQLEPPEGVITSVRTSDENMTLAFSFCKTGAHQIPVFFRDDFWGKHDFVVVGGDPVAVTAEGDGLTSATKGQVATFKLSAHDKLGNPTNPASLNIAITLKNVATGKELLAVLRGTEENVEEWCYTPVAVGAHRLVFVDGTGKDVAGPYDVDVQQSEEELADTRWSVQREEESERQKIERKEKNEFKKMMKALRQEMKELKETQLREKRARLTKERAAAAAKAAREKVQTEAEEVKRAKTKSKRTGGGFVVKYAWD